LPIPCHPTSYDYVRRTCLDANTLWSATFVGSELHSVVLRATVIRFSYWYRGESSRERKFLGAKVPCNFRSRERKFQGTKVPGSESTRERKSEGAKVPRSESSTYGTWERKFHNSAPMIVLNDNLSNPANFTPTMQTSVLCAVLKIAEFRYGSAVAPNASFSRVLSRMS